MFVGGEPLLVERNLPGKGLLSPGFSEFMDFRVTRARCAYVNDDSYNTCSRELAFEHRFFGEDINSFSKNNNTIVSSFLSSGW